jgi:hypothetical protein
LNVPPESTLEGPQHMLSIMFDLPIVAFDIETIPDPDLGRRGLGLDGTDADVIEKMMRRRGEDTDGRTEYPVQPWHRIVCVCATIVEPKDGHVRILSLVGVPRVGAPRGVPSVGAPAGTRAGCTRSSGRARLHGVVGGCCWGLPAGLDPMSTNCSDAMLDVGERSAASDRARS